LKETQHSSLLARNIHRIVRIIPLRKSCCANRPVSLREFYWISHRSMVAQLNCTVTSSVSRYKADKHLQFQNP